MAAYKMVQHGGNDSMGGEPVHVKAKKKALGDLKSVMNSMASPKIADKGEHVVSVVRKAGSKPSQDFKSTGKGGVKAPDPLKLHHDEKSEFETPDEDAAETPDFEETEVVGGKSHMNDRANPEDDKVHAQEVDKALKAFLTRKKKKV